MVNVKELEKYVTTQSCKAKGRRAQQVICKKLLEECPKLEPDDILSRGMGQNGEDVMLSPLARKYYPFIIECKNTEKLNVVGIFNEHKEKYKSKAGLKMLIHSRNRQEPLVTMSFMDFMELYTNMTHYTKIWKEDGFEQK